MLKKFSIFALALLMITAAFITVHAEDEPYEPSLEELIQWKQSSQPKHISDDMLDQVITGNLYADYYGVMAASSDIPLRAFATCDRTMFQVGVPSTVTVHASGAFAPYHYSISPYRKPASSPDTDYYFSFGLNSKTDSISITPDGIYQYVIEFSVTASNGDYITFYSKYDTVTTSSFSDPQTVGGKIKAVIASEIRSDMTDRQKALAIHEWLTHNARYDLTLTIHCPDGVLLKGTGVCESYARAYQMFMSELGIPCVYVASSAMKHAWNMIYIDGGWYHVDVTWDDPTGRDIIVSGFENTTYFCVSDSFLSMDHTWDTKSTPPSGKGPLYPSSEPVSATDVSLGKNTIHIPETRETVVRFTAPDAGLYLFETNSSQKTNCIVYDEGMNEIENSIFSGRLCHYQGLTKGQVIYLAIEQPDSQAAHSETLTISHAPSAVLGDNKVTIAAGQSAMLLFTAPSDGSYVFETTGSEDTFGSLYNSDMSLITSDDDGGIGYNFKIVQQLQKNQVVIIGIEYYNSDIFGTETLSIYPHIPGSAPSASLTTLTGRRFSALTEKPTLLVFTQVGCMNCSNMLNLLSGYDLSVMNVVVADISTYDLGSIQSYYANSASGISGATLGYNASNYMWSLFDTIDPNIQTISTPAVFYINSDKKIVDYTTGYDSTLITRVNNILGVALRKDTFSESRLVLPAATEEIGPEAFKGTAAALIEIPADCTSIASNAFDACRNLKIILNHSHVAISPPVGVVVTDIPLS